MYLTVFGNGIRKGRYIDDIGGRSRLTWSTASRSDAASKDHLSGAVHLELGSRAQNLPDLHYRLLAISLLIMIESVEELKEFLSCVSGI